MAASVTVRVIGPAVSWLCAIGNDARAAHQAERRLDADEAAVVRRRDDGAVGLGPDADRRVAGGDRAAGSRNSSPKGCGRARTGSCPGPPRPLQPLDECVDRKLAHSLRFVLPRMTAPASRSLRATNASRRRDRALERQRPGRRRHPVGGADVVLDQHRDAVQRAARALGLPLRVERGGDGRRVRVQLDHVVQRRPLLVERVDAPQVLLDQRARRVLARLHPLLQVGDRGFLEIRTARRPRRAECRAARRPAGRPAVAAATAIPPTTPAQETSTIDAKLRVAMTSRASLPVPGSSSLAPDLRLSSWSFTANWTVGLARERQGYLRFAGGW